MKYLLDTNTCIRYINGRSPQLRTRFLSLSGEDIAVCSVVKAELFYGSAKSEYPAKSRTKQEYFLQALLSLPFDDKAAEVYAPMRARLEKLGTPIGANDMLIAAIALANDLILVTHNTREFVRIDGLKIEDWEI
ncbi:MAG: type II toxin-antitoxin system VapC family toxin [Burkholderiales bacterium]|nr:type II toxin-antitoxin system VapC family toxin [Anaerolineae bacterium]